MKVEYHVEVKRLAGWEPVAHLSPAQGLTECLRYLDREQAFELRIVQRVVRDVVVFDRAPIGTVAQWLVLLARRANGGPLPNHPGIPDSSGGAA